MICVWLALTDSLISTMTLLSLLVANYEPFFFHFSDTSFTGSVSNMPAAPRPYPTTEPQSTVTRLFDKVTIAEPVKTNSPLPSSLPNVVSMKPAVSVVESKPLPSPKTMSSLKSPSEKQVDSGGRIIHSMCFFFIPKSFFVTFCTGQLATPLNHWTETPKHGIGVIDPSLISQSITSFSELIPFRSEEDWWILILFMSNRSENKAGCKQQQVLCTVSPLSCKSWF